MKTVTCDNCGKHSYEKDEDVEFVEELLVASMWAGVRDKLGIYCDNCGQDTDKSKTIYIDKRMEQQ